MKEGILSWDSLLKVTHCSVCSCDHVCKAWSGHWKGRKWNIAHLYPHWIQKMMPIFPSLYPMDSEWESWISQAFGKQTPGRAGRKSAPEQANSRKMSNQIFFLSHSLDKLPSERHLGRLDLLVTTDYLVSKKRTRRTPDPHREMSESTEHTIPKTWGLRKHLISPPQWLLTSQLVSIPNWALNIPRVGRHPRLYQGTKQEDISYSGTPAHRPSGCWLFCFESVTFPGAVPLREPRICPFLPLSLYAIPCCQIKSRTLH